MGALPVVIESKRELPDYLPARMVNEFAYCPRLFFYEWVEGLFQESKDTVEGAIQHGRVDARSTALPAAKEIEAKEGAPQQTIHSRSVTLASERLRGVMRERASFYNHSDVKKQFWFSGEAARGRCRVRLFPPRTPGREGRGPCGAAAILH